MAELPRLAAADGVDDDVELGAAKPESVDGRSLVIGV